MIRPIFLIFALCCTTTIWAQDTQQDNKETLDWVQRRAVQSALEQVQRLKDAAKRCK